MKPMLCKTYDHRSKLVVDENFVYQPKLDGVRCLVEFVPAGTQYLGPFWEQRTCKVARINATSRNEKPLHVSHIVQPLAAFMSKHCSEQVVLDGELYIHGVEFQDIQGRVSAQEHPEKVAVEYHIYDVYFIERAAPFSERLEWLRDLVRQYPPYQIRLVSTAFHPTPEKALDYYINNQYEGAIIRDLRAPYEPGKRSAGLYKYKKFHDDEFKVVGIKEGQGKNAGTPVYICETSSKKTFTVTAPGTYTDKQFQFNYPERYFGKMLTVKYQNKTKDGIPRFPVALRFRED